MIVFAQAATTKAQEKNGSSIQITRRNNEKNIPIPKNKKYEFKLSGVQKKKAKKDEIIIPTIEEKKRDTSGGSYSEDFLVTI